MFSFRFIKLILHVHVLSGLYFWFGSLAWLSVLATYQEVIPVFCKLTLCGNCSKWLPGRLVISSVSRTCDSASIIHVSSVLHQIGFVTMNGSWFSVQRMDVKVDQYSAKCHFNKRVTPGHFSGWPALYFRICYEWGATAVVHFMLSSPFRKIARGRSRGGVGVQWWKPPPLPPPTCWFSLYFLGTTCSTV